jgi:hypothetical protein
LFRYLFRPIDFIYIFIRQARIYVACRPTLGVISSSAIQKQKGSKMFAWQIVCCSGGGLGIRWYGEHFKQQLVRLNKSSKCRCRYTMTRVLKSLRSEFREQIANWSQNTPGGGNDRGRMRPFAAQRVSTDAMMKYTPSSPAFVIYLFLFILRILWALMIECGPARLSVCVFICVCFWVWCRAERTSLLSPRRFHSDRGFEQKLNFLWLQFKATKYFSEKKEQHSLLWRRKKILLLKFLCHYSPLKVDCKKARFYLIVLFYCSMI